MKQSNGGRPVPIALTNQASRLPTSSVRAVTAPAIRSWWPERYLVPESYACGAANESLFDAKREQTLQTYDVDAHVERAHQVWRHHRVVEDDEGILR